MGKNKNNVASYYTTLTMVGALASFVTYKLLQQRLIGNHIKENSSHLSSSKYQDFSALRESQKKTILGRYNLNKIYQKTNGKTLPGNKISYALLSHPKYSVYSKDYLDKISVEEYCERFSEDLKKRFQEGNALLRTEKQLQNVLSKMQKIKNIWRIRIDAAEDEEKYQEKLRPENTGKTHCNIIQANNLLMFGYARSALTDKIIPDDIIRVQNQFTSKLEGLSV